MRDLFFEEYVKPRDLINLVFDGERVNNRGRKDCFELRFLYCKQSSGVLIGRMRDGFGDSSIFAEIEPRVYTSRLLKGIPVKMTQVRRFSIVEYSGYFGCDNSFKGSYKLRGSDSNYGTWKMAEAKQPNLDRQIRKLDARRKLLRSESGYRFNSYCECSY